jgi:hypothetical protein
MSGIDGRIYNVADDEPVTSAEILRFLNQPVAQEAEALPLDDPWEGIVDTARIRNELGFRPSYPSFQTPREDRIASGRRPLHIRMVLFLLGWRRLLGMVIFKATELAR